jgi:hypothetical protein
VNGPPDWQLAVGPVPLTVAELQETPTAEARTVVHPVNLCESA